VLITHAYLVSAHHAMSMPSAQSFRDPNSQREGLYELEPITDAERLHIKDARGDESKPSYEKLKEEHFLWSGLPQDVLCPLSIFPGEATKIPVFAAKLTMIHGGPILSFCMMHSIADARAIFEIFKIWAENCKYLQNSEGRPSCQHRYHWHRALRVLLGCWHNHAILQAIHCSKRAAGTSRMARLLKGALLKSHV